MSVRRDSDYWSTGGSQGRLGPSVWEERVPALPSPGPEERGSHRSARPERNRQDHMCGSPQRRGRAQSWPLSEKEGLLGRSPRLLRGNGAPRLLGEDCEQETHDGYQAAVRRQEEQDLHGPCPGSVDESRQARSPRGSDGFPRPRLVPLPGYRAIIRRQVEMQDDIVDD